MALSQVKGVNKIASNSMLEYYHKEMQMPRKPRIDIFYGSGVEYTPYLCYTTKNKKVTKCQEDQE